MATTAPHSARNIAGDKLWDLQLTDVVPSALNPRKHFDQADLEALAESIRQHGLLEPIVVRYHGDRIGEPPYELIAGERRWRASQLAGLETIQARVLYDVDDATALKLALIENLQRKDLDPIEEAEGYRQLNRVVGLRQAEIAAAVNRSQPAVANAMRLLELPEDVRERIRAGELSVSHGIALARFKDFPKITSKIAAIAVEHRRAAKDLEKGVPFEWELERDGVIRRVDGYSAHFDTSVCQKCPFEAYRTGGMGMSSGWCLKPSHWEKLQAEADQRRQVELQEKLAAAQAGDASVLSIGDLDYGTYEDLSYGRTPAGCSEECPCRARALARNGSELVSICTDPKRFRQLKTAETRAASKEKREEGRRRAEQVAAVLDAIEAPGEREIALLAAAALTTISHTTAAKAAAEHAGVSDQLTIGFNRYELRQGDGLRQFASIDPTALVKLAIEAILRDELVNRYEGYGSGSSMTDWYLGETVEASE